MGLVSVESVFRKGSVLSAPDVLASPSAPPETVVPVRRHAVIICKKTRWEYERGRLSGASRVIDDEEVERRLKEKDVDATALKEKHDMQKRAEQKIVRELRKAGFSCTLLPLSLLPPVLPPTSLVIAAGGDGTFLAAASLVQDDTPVIGVNTDPQGSEGHLCVGGKSPPSDLLQRVLSPATRWTTRSRIKVTLHGKRGGTRPLLALNDVFVGETDSAKVSYYDISFDGAPAKRQKSSGIVVCTGSGSSAWYTSINRVLPSSLDPIFSALRSLGVELPEDAALAERVAHEVNERLVEPPDSPDLLFAVREPIFNKTFPETATRGRASKVSLKSRCSNAVLVLDGSRKIAWEYGSVITLEVDPRYALKTL